MSRLNIEELQDELINIFEIKGNLESSLRILSQGRLAVASSHISVSIKDLEKCILVLKDKVRERKSERIGHNVDRAMGIFKQALLETTDDGESVISKEPSTALVDSQGRNLHCHPPGDDDLECNACEQCHGCPAQCLCNISITFCLDCGRCRKDLIDEENG